MKRVLIGALIFVVYLACVIAGGFALHLPGGRRALFCIVLGLLGAATIAFAIWYLSRLSGESPQTGGSDSMNLDALLRDADHKLRTSRLRIKSIAEAQIIYIVGEDNSAKTQTVLQSGLDVELLAGNLFRDGGGSSNATGQHLACRFVGHRRSGWLTSAAARALETSH